ncbi:MAG: HAMP domain-containing histidine kinase [Proteobacteria bacterium]|nr:HAMP domain-containing histidine kinase [Pseudomonadota bacterium]
MTQPLAPVRRWFGGIAARIAAISIVGLVLAQLAAVGIALLLRPTELQVFQARWLVESVAEMARETFARPMAQRDAVLRQRAEAEFLVVEWQHDFAVRDDPRVSRGAVGRLQRGILDRLPFGFRVEVLFEFPPGGGSLAAPDRHIRRVPPDDGVWSESVGGAVPGTFTIAIRGPDDMWMLTRPRQTHLNIGWVVFGAWLVATAVVGAFAAWWAAHRLARPLEALAGEAARAGAGLEPQLDAMRGAPNEVRTIGDALARMRGQLVRHVEDRTRLLAAISHDLRTPLTRLRLRAEGIGEESEKVKALADLEEMEKMIAETLAFARADALEAKPDRFDLAALVETVVDERADLDHKVSYAGPASLVIEGRAGAMKRALANLIDNAIVYGGNADVRLAPSDDKIEIIVADEGPGIPAERLEDVFRPFVRLEASRSRETGGAGLGLAVVRDIARAHGGDVTLRNRPIRGLEATLTLPRIA